MVGAWLAQGWRMVGAGLAQGWRMAGAGLAHGWRRVGAWLAHGCRSGESARLPPMCPEFNSRTARHTRAEFAGSFTLLRGVFLRALRFPRFLKTPVFNLILFDLS